MLAPKSIASVSAADDSTTVLTSDTGNDNANQNNQAEQGDPDLSEYHVYHIGTDGPNLSVGVNPETKMYYKLGNSEEIKEVSLGFITNQGEPITLYSENPLKNASFHGEFSTIDLSDLTELENLEMGSGTIKNLNLSSNTNLKTFCCVCPVIESIDVSNNPELETFQCVESNLASLDLTHCPKLEKLFCDKNKLKSLDLSKNTALTLVNCSENQLTSLDVSKNTALENLFIHDNKVGELDISNNSKLKWLECDRCDLEELDTSKNANIEYIDCSGNSITSLDLSKNPALSCLTAYDNEIASIDLSKNTELLSLYLNKNKLKNVDISKNTKLGTLELGENELKTLDLSKNTKLEYIDINANPFDSFDSVIYPAGNENMMSSEIAIPGMTSDHPKEVKAGEKIDLSKYKSCGNKKSYCELEIVDLSNGVEQTGKSVIPESTENMILVIGNAYADKDVMVRIYNDNSGLVFVGYLHIIKNPDAPAAPGAADGDVPVDDVSGTITSAESTKNFDAQEVKLNEDTHKYVLGEKVSKEDLKLGLASVPANEARYNQIAKADKTFNKEKAKLFVYDITLSSDSCDRFKLKDGINLTIKYPADLAKDWNKYNFKVYHFVDFDYDNLEKLDETKIVSEKCTADKDGIHFKAPSFSYYAISATPKSAGNSSPQTGESTVMLNIIILIILLSTAGITGVIAKRKGELF